MPTEENQVESAKALHRRVVVALTILEESLNPRADIVRMQPKLTECNIPEHWRFIRFGPTNTEPTYVECVLPKQANIPSLLQEFFFRPLSRERIRMGPQVTHPCGCTTFCVWPRRVVRRRLS
jgi:hypothetical protein